MNIFTPLLLLFEPMSFGRGMLIMAAITVVIFVGVGIGGYFFLRILAGMINNRRDSWELAGSELGLSVDRSKNPILKPLAGKRSGRNIAVEYFAVPNGSRSSTDCVAVKVRFSKPFNFSFKVEKPEMLYQTVADFLGSGDEDIGHEPFDKAFRVECSDMPSLVELLNVPMLDGETSTLLTDLMVTRKRFLRVIVDDESVCLGIKADVDDTSTIENAADRAIYLAGRFEAAGTKTATQISS